MSASTGPLPSNIRNIINSHGKTPEEIRGNEDLNGARDLQMYFETQDIKGPATRKIMGEEAVKGIVR